MAGQALQFGQRRYITHQVASLPQVVDAQPSLHPQELKH